MFSKPYDHYYFIVSILLFFTSSLAAAECVPTKPNLLGPYYREGAPFVKNIAVVSEVGESLFLFGTVFGKDCKPLNNVILDVWQANSDGKYYNVEKNRLDLPEKFKLRGKIITDLQGNYQFNTILPGQYPIGVRRYRPKHIHIIVRHPDYLPLTTQLYFFGDRYNKKDPFIKPSLIMQLSKVKNSKVENSHTSWQGNFNFILQLKN